MRREFWRDLLVFSPANLPLTSASLRLVVVWMGVRSIRCTNSGTRLPPRFNCTTNFVFFIVCPFLYSTLRNRTPRTLGRGSVSGLQCRRLFPVLGRQAHSPNVLGLRKFDAAMQRVLGIDISNPGRCTLIRQIDVNRDSHSNT